MRPSPATHQRGRWEPAFSTSPPRSGFMTASSARHRKETTMTEHTPAERLAYLAFQMLYPGQYGADAREDRLTRSPAFRNVRRAVMELWDHLGAADRSRFSKIRKDLADPVHGNPE